MFEHIEWLHVPKVRWDLTTSRVLTMDFINGGQVNDLEYIKEHKINPFEVSDKLGRLYSQMIFINGFVHSDPHPGNIFVRKSERGDCDIILLDHGLYAVSLIHKIKKRHAFFNNFYSEFE
jgi:aarF domain-containing kinase